MSLNVAVIGVGALGRHHARILSQMGNVNLVGVAEPNEEQGKAVAESCQTEWFADYKPLLDRCDAVSLVVPTVLHHRIATDCFAAGKSVLIEKPLTANTDEAKQLIELAHKKNVVLQVGHVERFNPAYEIVEQQIKSPRFIQAERLSPFSFRSTDIGVVHDLMIHDLELILNLVDSPIQSVEAHTWSVMSDKEDTAHARLTFKNGCMANISASRINPTAKRTMQIWDAQSRVELDMHTRTVETYRAGAALKQECNPVSLAMKPGADIAALRDRVFSDFIAIDTVSGSEADALTAELANFVEAVRGNDAVRVGGGQALQALQVAEMILNSAHKYNWTTQEAQATSHIRKAA